VWSDTMAFLPPAWQAAQLALNIFSPAFVSCARDGDDKRRLLPTIAHFICLLWHDSGELSRLK